VEHTSDAESKALIATAILFTLFLPLLILRAVLAVPWDGYVTQSGTIPPLYISEEPKPWP